WVLASTQLMSNDAKRFLFGLVAVLTGTGMSARSLTAPLSPSSRRSPSSPRLEPAPNRRRGTTATRTSESVSEYFRSMAQPPCCGLPTVKPPSDFTSYGAGSVPPFPQATRRAFREHAALPGGCVQCADHWPRLSGSVATQHVCLVATVRRACFLLDASSYRAGGERGVPDPSAHCVTAAARCSATASDTASNARMGGRASASRR